MKTHHVVLGAGGYARETYWILQSLHPERSVVFFERAPERAQIAIATCNIPVYDHWEFASRSERESAFVFSVAVEDPVEKRKYVAQALEAGLQPAAPLVCPSTHRRPDAVLGAGTVVHARCCVSTNTRTGDFVLLLPGAGLAHDCRVGNYATCGMLSSIAGYAELGEGAYVGQRSSVRERGRVAPWVHVDMQSCVVSDILEEGVFVSGLPARPVNRTGGTAR